jgi:FlaG/FlaF family flagellin (archaellin)
MIITRVQEPIQQRLVTIEFTEEELSSLYTVLKNVGGLGRNREHLQRLLELLAGYGIEAASGNEVRINGTIYIDDDAGEYGRHGFGGNDGRR